MTLRTYRLNSKEDPTDELLDKLMEEVGKAVQEESRMVDAVLEARMKDVSRQVTELKRRITR
ncbi:hypothetical protein [Tannerella sp.]|uniref:hypothetical protein n=1 Tax=Tannerella sp. TaxID=2382127 RepID=UPI0026DB21F9|nr:hypothetical protein [Tannerella sp.]MDO4702422.1 hypothetical protein [Tannerella sp.]